MLFPFISRARFDDMLREKNTQIGDRDRRISELEAERRMLWDKLCLLGIGAPLFDCVEDRGGQFRGEDNGRSLSRLKPGDDAENYDATHQHSPEAGVSGSRRPSQIMRRMDRVAEARWLRKMHPAKAAEHERDEVIRQLDAAHREAVRQVKQKQ